VEALTSPFRLPTLNTVPSILRSRIALVVMLGAFLIPIGMSSLRGLTHVLTCRQQVASPFTLIVPDRGAPTVVSSTIIERGGEAGLCGGLFVNPQARAETSGRVAMTLPIENRTKYRWQGTVRLVLGKTTIPIGIGEVPAGATESDTVVLRLDPGSHEISGSLLIGP
jgi:hypothetical protein